MDFSLRQLCLAFVAGICYSAPVTNIMLGQKGVFLLSNESRQGIFIVVVSFSV